MYHKLHFTVVLKHSINSLYITWGVELDGIQTQ